MARASLTVTASSPVTTYGTVPVITPGYAGFVNGDTASSLTTAATCSTTDVVSSPVAGSPYASSCSGAVDPNYTMSYAAGSVTVSQAPLTVTAASGSVPYGSNPPAVTPIYAGFKGGDTASSLTTQPTCSTTATNGSPVHGYMSRHAAARPTPTTPSAMSPGTITVTPAPIAVAVSGRQANSGPPNFAGTDSPPVGVTVDTGGLTCSQVNPGTAISGNLPSGSYTLVAASCTGVTLSGSNATNYSPSYTSSSGDFTVTGAVRRAATTPAADLWLLASRL